MSQPESGVFDKYRQELKRIREQSGVSLPRLSWRAYLSGFLSMPWIWVWSYLVLASGYIIFLLFNQSDVNLQLILQQQSSNHMPIYLFWEFCILSCLSNYTLAFLTRKSYPRLETILFLISLMVLLILVVLLWPYFGFLFK